MSARSTTVDSKTLAADIEAGLGELQEFSATPEFRELLADMWTLAPEDRAAFVADVVLRDEELDARGIRVPDNITIQRSAFRDNRPTLFCIVLYIPDGRQWSKVTITYDNESGSPALPYPASE